MATTQTHQGTLEDRRLPVPARLAAAWASFMFLYIYVDYLALYKPGFLDEIRGGAVHDFETGPLFVGSSLTLIAIPSLMVVLSAALPARIARPANLVVAALYIPVSIYNASGEPWSYGYFYGLSIALEVLILLFVLRTAWTWPRTIAPSSRTALDASQVAMGR